MKLLSTVFILLLFPVLAKEKVVKQQSPTKRFFYELKSNNGEECYCEPIYGESDSKCTLNFYETSSNKLLKQYSGERCELWYNVTGWLNDETVLIGTSFEQGGHLNYLKDSFKWRSGQRIQCFFCFETYSDDADTNFFITITRNNATYYFQPNGQILTAYRVLKNPFYTNPKGNGFEIDTIYYKNLKKLSTFPNLGTIRPKTDHTGIYFFMGRQLYQFSEQDYQIERMNEQLPE